MKAARTRMANSVPSRPSPRSSRRNTAEAPFRGVEPLLHANIGTGARRCKGTDHECVIGSTDQAAAAVPARPCEEGTGARQEPGRPGQGGAPAGGPGAVGIGAHEGPVDQKPPADDVIARNEAPLAAVEAVVAVVPHDEILSLGNRERTEVV